MSHYPLSLAEFRALCAEHPKKPGHWCLLQGTGQSKSAYPLAVDLVPGVSGITFPQPKGFRADNPEARQKLLRDAKYRVTFACGTTDYIPYNTPYKVCSTLTS